MFILERGGNIGNMHKIVSINRGKKKKVKILFDDEEELLISESNYLHAGYLFPGKLLDDTAYYNLIKYESEEPYRQYLRNLLKKGHYSVYQCMVKLIQKKELEPKDARRLVGDLEREGVINDKIYAEIKVDILKSQGLSPEGIREYLKYRAKVDEEIIEELDEQIESIDNELLDEILGNIFEKYKKEPLLYRKDKAKQYLRRKGYELEQARSLVNNFVAKHDNTIKDDYDIAKADKRMEALLKKFSNYHGKALRYKIKDVLYGDLYSKDDIEAILEKYKDEFVEVEEDRAHEDVERIYNKYIANRGLNKTKRKKIYFRELSKIGYRIGEILSLIEEKENE